MQERRRHQRRDTDKLPEHIDAELEKVRRQVVGLTLAGFAILIGTVLVIGYLYLQQAEGLHRNSCLARYALRDQNEFSIQQVKRLIPPGRDRDRAVRFYTLQRNRVPVSDCGDVQKPKLAAALRDVTEKPPHYLPPATSGGGSSRGGSTGGSGGSGGAGTAPDGGTPILLGLIPPLPLPPAPKKLPPPVTRLLD